MKKKFLKGIILTFSIVCLAFVITVFAENPDSPVSYNSTMGDVNYDVYEHGEQKFIRVQVSPKTGFHVKQMILTSDELNETSDETFDAFGWEYTFEITDIEDDYNVEVIFEENPSITVKLLKTINGEEQNMIDYVQGYQGGDIVLPSDCFDSNTTCKLNFVLGDHYSVYSDYVNNHNDINDDDKELFTVNADESNFYEQGLLGDTYSVTIDQDFDQLGVMDVSLAYNDFKIYAKNYLGFNVTTEIDNFNDILRETGGDVVSFNMYHEYADSSEIFYGSNKVTLDRIYPTEVVYNEFNNMDSSLEDFAYTGSSNNGYSITPDSLTNTTQIIIDIEKYYLPNISVDVNGTLNGTDISFNYELNLYAFAGNAGQLLLIDENGDNCKEGGVDCSDPSKTYYSTQYRGALKAFYSNSYISISTVDVYKVNLHDKTIDDNAMSEELYERNTNFNPYALAIFYNSDDMIVGTKQFNLNELVEEEGYVNNDGLIDCNITTGNEDFFYKFDVDNKVKINKINYFDANQRNNISIMYDLPLISVKEAEEESISKISLFLTNGEVSIDNDFDIQYGIGNGREMLIYSEEEE